jgi:predicted methyltransferase
MNARLACCAAALLAGVASGCAAAPPPVSTGTPPPAQAPPAEPAATASDSSADAAAQAPSGARPVDFFAIGRGDRVADLGDGRGYSIARIVDAVGPFGKVYVRHDPRTLHARSSESRAEAPEPSVADNVIRMDTPIDHPLAPEATRLDCVTLLFFYHQLVAEQRDRRAWNAAVFRALRPGGLFIVEDHAPLAGAAASDAGRIAPQTVRAEVEAVGFQFVEAADFISQGAATAGGPPGSQYALKFQKPR